jgi:hypothetical protein
LSFLADNQTPKVSFLKVAHYMSKIHAPISPLTKPVSINIPKAAKPITLEQLRRPDDFIAPPIPPAAQLTLTAPARKPHPTGVPTSVDEQGRYRFTAQPSTRAEDLPTRSKQIVAELVQAEKLADTLLSELEKGLKGQVPTMANPSEWLASVQRDLQVSLGTVHSLRQEYASAVELVDEGIDRVEERKKALLGTRALTVQQSSLDATMGYSPQERTRLLDTELQSLSQQEAALGAAFETLDSRPRNQNFLQQMYGSWELSLIAGNPGVWTAHGEFGQRIYAEADDGSRKVFPMLMGGIDSAFGGVGYTATKEPKSSGPMANLTMIPYVQLGHTPRGRSAVLNVPGIAGFGIYERGEANIALAVPVTPNVSIALDVHFGNPAIKGITQATLGKIGDATLAGNEWAFAARQWLSGGTKDD